MLKIKALRLFAERSETEGCSFQQAAQLMQTDVETCILDLITWMEIFQCFIAQPNICLFAWTAIAFIYVAGQREALHCWLQEIIRVQTRDYLSINIHLFAFRRVLPALQTRGEQTLYARMSC